MRRFKNLFLSATLTLSVVAGALLPLQTAEAAFYGGRIIDDGIFSNSGTMSAASIDAWLNNFGGSCISPNSGFRAPSLTGYSPSTGFTYGSDTTAGQIIYTAGSVYGVNPQVILTNLQKEESLVTGNAGCSGWRYVSAVGYGCPDSQGHYSYSGFELYSLNGNAVTSIGDTCVNKAKFAGFSRQIIYQTWNLKFDQQRALGNANWAVVIPNWDNSDDNAPGNCYGGRMTAGHFQVCPNGSYADYDGLTSIDGQTVKLETGATAAFYNYTPHFGGWQNFVSQFESWFGSTTNPCGHDPSEGGVSTYGHVPGDYTGDGRADAAVFRPSDGCWHVRAYGDVQFGQAGDIPVPADYNGDGKTDIAVYRPSEHPNGENLWHVRGVGDYAYGHAGDIPVPGDYNGDGRADIGVYRPGQLINGQIAWHIGGVGDFGFGLPGDIPVPFDYNGDGKTDIAVFRPSTGDWHIRAVGDYNAYGQSGDIPVPGSYPGFQTGAVYRPLDGGWRVRAYTDFPYGFSTDIPVPSDYNDDNRYDAAIFRPGNGDWHIRGVGDWWGYGNPGDIPAISTLNVYILDNYYHYNLNY